MSHLRPDDPTTGKPKAYDSYTMDEKKSAVSEIEAASHVRPASAEAVALAKKMHADTDRKEATLDIETKETTQPPKGIAK